MTKHTDFISQKFPWYFHLFICLVQALYVDYQRLKPEPPFHNQATFYRTCLRNSSITLFKNKTDSQEAVPKRIRTPCNLPALPRGDNAYAFIQLYLSMPENRHICNTANQMTGLVMFIIHVFMVLCVIHFHGLVSHIQIPVITKMEKIELAHHLRTLAFYAFVFYYMPP